MHRLRICHIRVIHGYLMEKTEPPTCRSRSFEIRVKHIIIHCQIFMEARKECEIPENLYEAIGPYADTQKIEMYNLI